MKELEERIVQEGTIFPGNVVKVDTFLNHQIDIEFADKMAQAFVDHFANKNITKVFTIEASGIALATLVAAKLNVPCVFAKKAQSINLGENLFSTRIKSYTHQNTYDVIVAKYVLRPFDRILIIDDFLANGCALQGLIKLVKDAGAHVEGIGIAIEKGFQDGGRRIRSEGYDVYSLATIASIDEASKTITFAS